MTTDIAMGFSQRKPPDRTICVDVDLLAAFDTVCHTNLLSKINRSQHPPPPTTARLLSCYLRGRQARTCFRCVKSTSSTTAFQKDPNCLHLCSASTYLTCRCQQNQSSGSATLITELCGIQESILRTWKIA